MSRSQVFDVWEPVAESNSKMLLEKLTDDDNGLTLWLKSIPDGKLLCVRFDAHVAYRNFDESFRPRTFDVTGGFQFSLYKVRHSRWLDWFHTESLNYYKDVDYVHYAIFTSADCVDVLSQYPPESYWLDVGEME